MKTKPGILIDAADRWIYQGNEISQPDILAYFRQNLFRYERTYFIRNRFGELVEEGELDAVLGFPVHAVSAVADAEKISFLLDSGERVHLAPREILLDRDDCLYFEMPERGIPVRLTSSAMIHVSEWINDLTDEPHPSWTQGIPLERRSLSEYFEKPPAR